MPRLIGHWPTTRALHFGVWLRPNAAGGGNWALADVTPPPVVASLNAAASTTQLSCVSWIMAAPRPKMPANISTCTGRSRTNSTATAPRSSSRDGLTGCPREVVAVPGTRSVPSKFRRYRPLCLIKASSMSIPSTLPTRACQSPFPAHIKVALDLGQLAPKAPGHRVQSRRVTSRLTRIFAPPAEGFIMSAWCCGLTC
jgi:hypothetical protein